MRFDVITLFPEMIEQAMGYGIPSRAINKSAMTVQMWNPRDYTHDVHGTVDDRPYGGGPGMLMQVKPLSDALNAAKAAAPQNKVVYLSPQGQVLNQPLLTELSQAEGLTLICGRYEGVDERVLDTYVDMEISIGDYVLSGGEPAAIVLMDGVSRLLPDVLGEAQSAVEDSFTDGLLDCPHYTRPEEINGQTVPAVLLSGDHQKIAMWREQQALGNTFKKRPDLLAKKVLTEQQRKLLKTYLENDLEK